MSKLVVLKVGQGTCDRGFPLKLQISEDGQPPFTQIDSWLPPASDIPHLYHLWQAHYHDDSTKCWETLIDTPPQVTNIASLDSCQQAIQGLEASMRSWLEQPPIAALQRSILTEVLPEEPALVILKTKDPLLCKLPWHIWELFERRPLAQFVLAADATSIQPLDNPDLTDASVITQTLPPVSHSLDSPRDGFRTTCCINPHCPRPHHQRWADKHCSSCGTSLRLNERYIPLKCISSERSAQTYTVYDVSAQSEQVLKVMVSTKPAALEQFRREAMALATIRHPGLPKVTASGYFDVTVNHPQKLTLPCLVMAKIPGISLQTVLDEHPRGCSPAVVLDWLKQAVTILRLLHSHQVIHRHLQPAHFIIHQDTHKLALVGLGGEQPLVLRHNVPLPPSYNPPEQRARGEVSAATDFYALGLICVHLLTGQHPATLRDETGAIQWRHLVRLDTPVADLLDWMVQTEVSKRPSSATAIQTRLTRIVGQPQPKVTERIHRHQYRSRPRVSGRQSSLFNGFLSAPLTVSHMSDWGVQAGLGILQGTMLGGLGGAVGAGCGYWLAYSSPLQGLFQDLFANHFTRLLPLSGVVLSPAILVFAGAGLGTAWGLELMAGNSEQSRLGTARWMGVLGYAVGWLFWQTVAEVSLVQAFTRLTGIAAIAIVLGVGLRSHQLLHVVVTAVGTTSTFASWVRSDFFTPEYLLLLYPAIPTLHLIGSTEFWASLILLASIGGVIGFWLAVSNICALPCLYFLSRMVQTWRDG